jgi:hypothetical protein
MKSYEYVLRVYCRRNDMSQDAGDHCHATVEANSPEKADAKAMAKVMPDANWLHKFYDDIDYKLIRNPGTGQEEVVRRWRWIKPVSPARKTLTSLIMLAHIHDDLMKGKE